MKELSIKKVLLECHQKKKEEMLFQREKNIYIVRSNERTKSVREDVLVGVLKIEHVMWYCIFGLRYKTSWSMQQGCFRW